MWSAYDIFFEDGFEFQLGGKLPGLCGGKCYTGNAMPETGDGWSARIMWRKDGNAVQLIYFMGQKSVYGDDFKWDLNGTIPQKQFTTGTWHRIVNKVSMNTIASPGNGDKNGKCKPNRSEDSCHEMDDFSHGMDGGVCSPSMWWKPLRGIEGLSLIFAGDSGRCPFR
jgi:hypothetical protein